MENVIKWSELFPTKWSFTIFMTYIVLFAAQGKNYSITISYFFLNSALKFSILVN